MCVCVYVHGAIQAVFLPHIQYCWDRLGIHCNPDQDKAVAEAELMNEAMKRCKLYLGFWIAAKVFMPLRLLSMTSTRWLCSRFRYVTFRSVMRHHKPPTATT